jgi:hypothetical protein
MKNAIIMLMAATGILLFSGCMTGYGSISDHQKRQMTTQEIVTMTTEGISDSLIISQIRATHSEFTLSSQDILNLKKAGVSEGVIGEMIYTSDHPASSESYPRDYYYVSLGYLWNNWWWDPWGIPLYYPSYHFPVLYRSGFYQPYTHFGHFAAPHWGGGGTSHRGGRHR